MRKLLVIALIISTAMVSCEDQPLMYVEKNVSLKKVYSFPINKTGEFEGSSVISLGRLINELTEYADGELGKTGYTIKEINIKSLELHFIRNSDNAALYITLSSAMINSDFNQVPLLDKRNVQLNEVTIAGVNADNFFRDGIENLNKDLDKAVKKIKPNAFITVSIKGNSFPANSKASLIVQMDIDYNLQYSYCEETLFLITDPIVRCL